MPCRTIKIQHQDDMKNRMKRRNNAWRNGCFRIMDDHLFPSIPNHHPCKMDVLPKTFLQIILDANWLVWHTFPSPKQQRRPLLSPLSLSSFYANRPTQEAVDVAPGHAHVEVLHDVDPPGVLAEALVAAPHLNGQVLQAPLLL